MVRSMPVAAITSIPTGDARQRILDVTAALVLEHGVAGVAQRQIAERVGIKAASLYHHFASKNEIVEAVFRQGIDVMERAWDEAAASTTDPRERLAAHVRAHLSALFENGPYTAAHVTAFRTAPAEVRQAVVPMRDAYGLVDRVMGGSQGMEVYIDFGEADAMQDPVVLQTIDAMQDRLERDHPHYVVRTDSLTLSAKRSYRVLNEDRPDFYTIPDDRKALAQTLLLFDMAAPEDREVVVPDDYSSGRVTVRLRNYGSMEYVAFFEEIQAVVEEAFAPLRERLSERLWPQQAARLEVVPAELGRAMPERAGLAVVAERFPRGRNAR